VSGRFGASAGHAGYAEGQKVLSTVGSASATGSAGRTNWDGDGDGDGEGEAESMDLDAGSGYDSAGESVVTQQSAVSGGAGGHARRSRGQLSGQLSQGSGSGSQSGVGMGMGMGEAERIVRRLDGGEAGAGKALVTPEGDGKALGRFYFEERK
jgi:hypothetical protein